MKTLTSLKPILFTFLIFCTSLAQAQLKKVKTAYGSVTGIIKDHVSIFKGVPFAAPPVGELRWKAPQPPKKWNGLLNCDTFSASPVQNNPVPFMMWTQEFIAPAKPLSEDCLYLNIWTPAASNKAKLPVIVWIYGGGFVSGSAACPIYDGEELSKKGVIFISINYRVGIFGFLAHPELSKESGHGSGNYALLDQIEALKWIRQNIGEFGGDPENVTIAGQSAGSMSVNALIASPLAKGLFQKAIAQSGGILGGRISRQLSEAEKTGEAVSKQLSANSIAELRSKSAEEIQKAASAPGLRFGPVLDDYVLPLDPVKYFQQKKQNNVAIMTGWVTGDGALAGIQPSTPEKFRQEAVAKYGDQSNTFLTLFKADNDEELKATQSKLGLISFGVLPSRLLSDYNEKPVYIYQFNHVPPDKPNFPNYGAFHTAEVPYALKTLKMWDRAWKTEDLNLENAMSDYWVNFARTGNPNGKGLPEWQPYNKTTGVIMEFTDSPKAVPGLLKKELDFLVGQVK
ncbi:carboxylesterase family protein [Emticicia sp. CRIBPO]|uniref:carboxylesterase/lipase family protein n=1 Tax=Emticicia sp. CRIBPO TaxID=2683258 RepID=UPI001411E7D5|nr:carboxylesterase family protein [Emticicia sp. CRIBPO]NBA86911.1 carboxylesterase family protein [Emticicia sp. CRIBPO]